MKAPSLIDVRRLSSMDMLRNNWPLIEFTLPLSGIKYWALARPEGYYSLGNRIKLAYGVFTGKYDALKWEGQ